MKPFATANTQTILCSVGRMDAYAGCSRRGTTARDNATLDWLGRARQRQASQRRQGASSYGPTRTGKVTHGNAGLARQGPAGRGLAGQRRLGVARHGKARRGKATQARQGMARQGLAGQGNAGAAGQGKARPGRARHKPGGASGVQIALNFLETTTNTTHTT